MYKEILKQDEFECSAQKKILCKLEQVLILLQEVGDEKVEIGQHIIDLIDNKYRQLDQDLRNLGILFSTLWWINFFYYNLSQLLFVTDIHKEQENTEPHAKEVSNNKEPILLGNNASSGNNGNGGNSGNDRGNKRPRRSRTETTGDSEKGVELNNSGSGETARASGQTKKQSGTTASKKKKRKSRQSQQQVEDNPPATQVKSALREDELQHDADEPTYCLCDQISYGEMILCDNDLCPIEWFHFVCVSLTSKPKGKWFCPKCRGDRPNVMKPKSQFLKELERYNKEKEEKS